MKTYTTFYNDESKTGNDYGIQIQNSNLLKVFRMFKGYSLYNEFKFTSHHGTVFNPTQIYNLSITLAPHNGKLLFIFETKNWVSEINEYGTNNNFQSKMSVKQKIAFNKILQRAGFKIEKRWNHLKNYHTVSILTTTPVNYVVNKTPNASNKEIQEMVDKLNDFDNDYRIKLKGEK